MPEEANVNLAELGTWYRKEKNVNKTIFAQEHVHLPEHISLKDIGTVLVKKQHQSILLTPNPISEANVHENKMLFKKWGEEEDIDDSDEVTIEDILAVFPTMTI